MSVSSCNALSGASRRQYGKWRLAALRSDGTADLRWDGVLSDAHDLEGVGAAGRADGLSDRERDQIASLDYAPIEQELFRLVQQQIAGAT